MPKIMTTVCSLEKFFFSFTGQNDQRIIEQKPLRT